MGLVPGPISVIEGLVDAQNKVGDFVANGPSTGIGGHVRDQYRNRCDQFANLPPWAKALNPGAQGTMGRVCKPYWDGQGTTGPVPQTPFTGGQCPGINYNFTWVWKQGNFTSGPTTRQLTGPLNLVIESGTAAQQEACASTNRTYSAILMVGANGSQSLASGCNVELVSLDVSRVDGQADNCGDPPGELVPGPNPPPDPGPTPGPEPTADPSNPTGVPLLPIPPYEDPIGGPTPIVAPEENPPTLGPGDIPGSSDSQEGGGANAGDAISGESGADGAGDDISFGPPPDGRVWVGALLQLVIPDRYGIIPNSAPANPVASRVVGNASLTYEGGRGTAVRVRSGNIELFRPNGALRVLGLYVNCLPGITYTVRPISVLKCPENNCGETP